MKLPSLLILALFVWFWSPVSAKAHAERDPVFGLWLTEDRDAVIELYGCETKTCGRFYWLGSSENGDIQRDEHNHDAEQRDRPLCRMTFMTDFNNVGEGNYAEGFIYNPEDGWDYKAELKLEDKNTLNVRGYILLPIFGRSQTWTRVHSHPACKVESP